jgi:FXSXX-COOH protein
MPEAGAESPPTKAKRPSDLVDLSGLSLADLRGLPNSVVAESLRRIVAELDLAAEPVAGFQSAI